MVKEIQGFYCERCRRFMLLGEDMNAHLRSITHYRSFVAEVRSLTSNTPSKVTPTTESKETKQADVSNYVPQKNRHKTNFQHILNSYIAFIEKRERC